MTRFARVHYAGGIYHLISKFVNKQFLINDKSEREKYLEFLGNAAFKTDAIILGYCIMSSHVHIVVRAGVHPLEKLMKSVNAGFAGFINRQNPHRDGAVFSGRYKSVLVDKEEYLFELIRYVHNNPVRAGLVESAKDSTWSSHRAYLGLDDKPDWLNTGYVLSMFNEKAGWARRQFDAYVEQGKVEKRRADLNGEESTDAARKFQHSFGDSWRMSGPIVGNDKFALKVLEDISTVDSHLPFDGNIKTGVKTYTPSLDETIAVVCSELGLEPWEFENQPKRTIPARARKLIVYLWVNVFGGKQIDVARKLKSSSAAVTGWYSKVISNLPEYDQEIENLKSKFPTFLKSASSEKKVRYSFEIDNLKI